MVQVGPIWAKQLEHHLAARAHHDAVPTIGRMGRSGIAP